MLLGARLLSLSFISSCPVRTPILWWMSSPLSRISRILLVIQNSRPSVRSGRELDDVLLLAVLEDEAHEALGHRSLFVGVARFAEGLLDESGVLRLLLGVFVLRLDERVVELPASSVLVLLEEVAQVAHERVELGQTLGDVGVDRELLLHRSKQVSAPLRERELVGLRDVLAGVDAEGGQRVHGDEQRRHDDDEQRRSRVRTFLRFSMASFVSQSEVRLRTTSGSRGTES